MTAAAAAAGPFPADAAVAARVATLESTIGDGMRRELEPILAGPGATIAAASARSISARFGLTGPEELALLALPLAARLARAPISGYRVGVVGVEAGSGDLVLGANLEFPGTDLGATVHAEGFATLRARRRGDRLAILALTEADPCAHCRQTLAESSAAGELRLIDPSGHRLGLADLYPWPFTPAALGAPGDDPTTVAFPALDLDGPIPVDVRAALVEAGGRAHAPYTRTPSAAALRLRDGRIAAAGAVESVAFNPTIPALQAALVEVVAAGAPFDAIEAAWLARPRGRTVDPATAAASLLATIAPGATFAAVDWASGA